MPDANPKAVVLLSGGLDSATVAAIALDRRFAVHALTVAYGQRHSAELEAARRVAAGLGVREHVFSTVDLRVFGNSALTDALEVPKSSDVTAIATGISITYVPARNTILLALALANAEAIGATEIFIGVNAVDYAGYPDCRPEFIAAFQNLANVATKMSVEGARLQIHAPLLSLSKAEIIREGTRLGVDFAWTHSCYDPSPTGLACGFCDSCLLRKKGFEDAGIADPAVYSAAPN